MSSKTERNARMSQGVLRRTGLAHFRSRPHLPSTTLKR
jgi:hypothetical protein